MSLPLTVNNTYAANESVSAQDIVDIQEQVAGYWAGRRRQRRMMLSAYAAQDGSASFSSFQQFNTWGPGYRAAAGSGQYLFFALRLRYDCRVRNIRVAYQAVGGAVMPYQLRRNYQPNGTLVPVASGNLAVAGGAYNVGTLFGAPLPKHAIFKVSGTTDVFFHLTITSGGAGDRVYGISVDYDHIGVTL